jgi:hypothetical protein
MTVTQETNDDVQLHDSDTAPAVQSDRPPGVETPQDESKGNREAKYRVERNTAREALTAAEARIADLQVRELERLAGEHLAQPGDLLGIGQHSMADFLTPEGWVDQDAVADGAAALIESRPGLAKTPKVRATDSSQGYGGSGTPGSPTDFGGFLNNIYTR